MMDAFCGAVGLLVPPLRHEQVMKELHDTHPGITSMKALAHSLLWWPNIDADLERMVQSCCVCQESHNLHPKILLHPWEYPKSSWSRLHIPCVGPLFGRMYLTVVDAFSKWVKVAITHTASSESTIEDLLYMFATHGVPDTIVLDNASSFTSEQFARFCPRNNINHVTSAPFHVASYGFADWTMQSLNVFMRTPSNEST